MIGFQCTGLPQDVTDWAGAHGIVVARFRDGTLGLLADPAALARVGRARKEFDGGWLETAPGCLELAGRPCAIVAVASAQDERPCSARILSEGAVGGLVDLPKAILSTGATREAIRGRAADAWRVGIPQGPGSASLRISACDQTVRFMQFRVESVQAATGAKP